jgi:hypothetical protein
MIDTQLLFGISRFTVTKFVDDEEFLIAACESYIEAKDIYDYTIENLPYTEEHHIIITLYDFDKDANIELYDNFELL